MAKQRATAYLTIVTAAIVMVLGAVCSRRAAALEPEPQVAGLASGAGTVELASSAPLTTYVRIPLTIRTWPPAPGTPLLYPIPNPDGQSEYLITWSSVAQVRSYTLQEADNPAFAGATVVYEDAPAAYTIAGRAPGVYYYRVRAANTWAVGNWSNWQSTVVWPPSTIPASADTMIAQGSAETPMCHEIRMWAGYNGYFEWEIVRSLVRFDLSDIPAGMPITDAKLYVRLCGVWDHPDREQTITAHRVGSGWSECAVTWTTQPTVAEGYGTRAVGQGLGDWFAFDVTDLVRGWVNGEFANFGLWLRGPEIGGDDAASRAFWTSETDDSPYLEITYGTMGVSAQPVAPVGPAYRAASGAAPSAGSLSARRSGLSPVP